MAQIANAGKNQHSFVLREGRGEGRMGFSVFLALLVHGILLFGVGVSQLETSQQPSHVTLKLGLSGDSSSKLNEVTSALSKNLESNSDSAPTLSAEQTLPEGAIKQRAEKPAVLEQANIATEKKRTPPAKTRNFVKAFSKFQTNMDSQRSTTQGLNRTRELNSLSKFTAPETAYLNTWRRKCERIGRNNYPSGVLEGELTMLVSILRDGSLAGVKILRSSGQAKLDAAALATVRQAAPFQPFTVEMRKSYDRLDFTRTWQFSKQGTGIDF